MSNDNSFYCYLFPLFSIIKYKDYYEILGVSKDATEPDIREEYKRLALQVHPDKNSAPGAAEAFIGLFSCMLQHS